MSANQIAMAQRAIAGFIGLCMGRKTKITWGRNPAIDQHGNISMFRPKEGTAEEVALMCRSALHEAGHFHHTDFSAVMGLSPHEMALTNALEDARMEAEQVRKYPGAGLILDRGLEELCGSLDQSLDPAETEDQARIVLLYILVKAYLTLTPHPGMVRHSASLLAKGEKVLDPYQIDAVDDAMVELRSAANTHDTVVIAKALWAKLNPPQPEQAQGEEGAESQDNAQASPQGPSGPQGQAPSAPSNAEQPSQSSSQSSNQDTASEASSTEASQDAAGEGEGEGGQADQGEQGGQAPSAQGTPGSSQGASSASSAGLPGGSEAGDSEGSGSAASGSSPAQSPSLDLSSEMGTDMGKLLTEAYESKFGTPDLDPNGAEQTESDDLMQKALERALQGSQGSPQDLEEVMGQAQEQVEVEEQAQAAPSSSTGSSQAGQAGQAAGGGHADTSAPVRMDLDVRMTGVVSRLVRVFTKELQDKRRKPSKLAPAGGQIVPNRVWRVKKLGEMNVFKVKAQTSGIDAAVTILLDRSGSMDRDIVCAAQASLACSQALERITKVKTSIEMFPGNVNDLQTLQAFGQSARQIAKHVQDVYANGGTPLAEAMAQALPKLMDQRVQKRILLVVTDGEPNNHHAADREIRKAQSQGVEVMGIGIGSGASRIQHLIPQSVVITAVEGLPDALEQLFKSQLLTEKLAA
jgi:Mg-chelatase subunit ChlD